MKDQQRLVDLFVVGAAKSGTTSLYQAFKSLPMIALPVEKEPNFFNLGSSCTPGNGPGDGHATVVIRDISAYHKNLAMRNPAATRVACDFSVAYLYDDQAPTNIRAYNPRARIVMMLRNPVDRAWSHYLHLRRDLRETLDFDAALAREKDRMAQGYEFSWHYFHMGLYYQQVRRYLDAFGRERVLIYLYEDFRRNPQTFLAELAGFVGEPELADTSLGSDQYNATGLPKNRTLAWLINRPSGFRSFARRIFPRQLGSAAMSWLRNRNLQRDKQDMPLSTRTALVEAYRSDVDALGQLIGRDLSYWLQPTA